MFWSQNRVFSYQNRAQMGSRYIYISICLLRSHALQEVPDSRVAATHSRFWQVASHSDQAKTMLPAEETAKQLKDAWTAVAVQPWWVARGWRERPSETNGYCQPPGSSVVRKWENIDSKRGSYMVQRVGCIENYASRYCLDAHTPGQHTKFP